MIYLDNGATTYPKPATVVSSVNNALKYYGANPGRAGHALAMKASEMIYDTRKNIADFFGCDDPQRVIFTLNCTTAINTVLKGVLKEGDHVIISSLEHNSVLRPLEKLRKQGITYSAVRVFEGDKDRTVDSFRDAIRENTRLMVCTCASNVFGIRLPVGRICAMCRQYGVLTCVDAAQGAGLIPINLSEDSIDYLCFSGHKGLYGPMGTGGLIINCDTIPDSLTEGGTGSNSSRYDQPLVLPDKFESGTGNLPGIVGLNAGVSFVKGRGMLRLYKREIALTAYLYDRLAKNNRVKLYTNRPDINYHVPVLSFNIEDMESETVAGILSSKYNIAVRAGLHCAPLAHKSKNTLNGGTVRAVPSAFTSTNDIDSLASAIYNISRRQAR